MWILQTLGCVYIDMISNPEVADVFRKRAKIVSELCKTVESFGFLEVETPVLQGVVGGAEARPFVTCHDSLGRDLYLRIATELHLKRMLVGGFEKVYEIGRIFINEGISNRHNVEFKAMKWSIRLRPGRFFTVPEELRAPYKSIQ